MCGRVNVSDNEGVRLLLESLGMSTWPSRDPRYNIAPTQKLDVVCLQDGKPELVTMRWGLSLTVSGKNGKSTTRSVQNCRSDKVWVSPMWKPLITRQRALVPVNGFYEWRRVNKKIEAAFHIGPAHKPAMFFAALYRGSRDASDLPEVSIVTTEANQSMADVHDRMPVILDSTNAAMSWLQDDDNDSLNQLMKPAEDIVLHFVQVSSYVNKSSNEGPECIEPLVA